MANFRIHDVDSAGARAAETLKQVREQFGFVPNLLGVLANSPAALEAYTALSAIFESSGLSPVEQQVVLVAASVARQCEYCVAAHSVGAKQAGLSGDALGALREGRTLPDARLNELRDFTQTLVNSRGWPKPEELDSFLAAGFTTAHVLDVLVGIAMKTISNYSNHMAKPSLDKPFEPARWTAPQ
jgi:uncharacterized peroxidase-related enzyme